MWCLRAETGMVWLQAQDAKKWMLSRSPQKEPALLTSQLQAGKPDFGLWAPDPQGKLCYLKPVRLW